MIPLGEWTPDRPDQRSGVNRAENVVGDVDGYRPFPVPDILSIATSEPASGVTGAFFSETPPTSFAARGDKYVYAGTATKLHRYKLNGTAAWSDVTRASGGDYTSARWQFAKFGTRVIAVSEGNAPQSFVEGSSSTFAALAGSPPNNSRLITVVRDFVAMAPIGSTLYWSAINDPTDWTPSATTQSDTQIVPEGGVITGLAGGEFGLVFMENAVYRMTYVGTPLIFQFDKITSLLGLPNYVPIAQHEDMVFFYSGEGFYIIRAGQEIIPIGQGKVNRYFEAPQNGVAGESTIHSCSADPTRKLFIVEYTNAADDSTVNRALAYHWPSGRWTEFDLDEFAGYNNLTDAPTLFFPMKNPTSTTPDTKGVGAWDGAKLVWFDDYAQDAVKAYIETVEAQIFPGRRAFVTGVRPIVEANGNGPTMAVEIAARQRALDAITYSSPSSLNTSGLCPVRSSGRFHRARVTIDHGSWDHITGLDVEAVPEGTR